MTVIERAQKIKKDNPEKFGKMNEKKIASIISLIFGQIKSEIENMETDKIRIPGLGGFNTRMIQQKKEGEKILVKRTIFKLPRTKK